MSGALRPILDTLIAAMREVHDGALLPSRATAMASLARSILQTYETSEMEQRITALEAIHDSGERAASVLNVRR